METEKQMITKYLKGMQIDGELIAELLAFREQYETDEAVKERISKPEVLFYGKEILEMAIAALLHGENILLSGAKATGKNVLCETLAWLFGRPSYNVSFHVNTDSAALIGTDTFKNNEVQLRKGPIYECAQYGGFGILDEINMAKNDAVSVLHATLDYRRSIDVPGYSRIVLHPATRFIGTMNYGYAGTKELNEALISRFMVIDMPPLDAEEKGRDEDMALYNNIEKIAPKIIAEKRKIYKGVSPNVDFYSGFVYEMLGIPRELYTPLFAIARIVGWSAHRIEELVTTDKIIRPAYKSLVTKREYQDREERGE